MSRGPGVLGQSIIRELSETPGSVLPHEELKQRFPRQVADKSFYRALRSLKRIGLIFEDDLPGGRSYIKLTLKGDAELRALFDSIDLIHRTVTQARGFPVPDILTQQEEPSGEPGVDAYRRGRNLSD